MQDNFKVVLVGNVAAGKTSLICGMTKARLVNEYHSPTIGVDLVEHSVSLNGRLLRVKFWDTAGAEKYRAITRALDF